MPKSAEFFLRLIQRVTAFRSLPQDHVYGHLKNLSNGSIDMNVDGSGVAVNFDYVVPAGTVYDQFTLMRINFGLIDGAMQWGRFGGIGSGLTNGLLLQVLDADDVVQQHFGTDMHPIQANEDFIVFAGVDSLVEPTAGDDAIPIRFSIFKSGNPMTLFPNWRVRLVVQDDLRTISHFNAMVQGVLRRTREAKIS